MLTELLTGASRGSTGCSRAVQGLPPNGDQGSTAGCERSLLLRLLNEVSNLARKEGGSARDAASLHTPDTGLTAPEFQ